MEPWEVVLAALEEALPQLKWRSCPIEAAITDPDPRDGEDWILCVGRERGGHGRLFMEAYASRDLEQWPDGFVAEIVADGVEEYAAHH